MSRPLRAQGANRNQRPIEHAIERSLAALTIGVLKNTAAHEERRRQLSLAEWELQFQERISGMAGNQVASSILGLDFETPFYFSPGSRDSELDTPQYSVGTNVESGTGVMISANVTSWKRDEETDAVTGASVEISAVAPGTDEDVPYTAVVHLSFQGYSSMPEDESEMA